MSEGQVFVCKWERLPRGRCRGAVAQPSIQLEAADVGKLVEALTQAITALTSDGDPVIELDPPVVPGDRRDLFQDRIVVLGPKAHFRFDGYAKLVENGFCARCRWPLGGRTSEPLAVASTWPGDATYSWDPRAEGVHVLLIAEGLLAALPDVAREAFDVRPAVMPPGTRKRFLEVVPKSFIPEVSIKSLTTAGWHCNACGRVHVSNGPSLGWGVHAVARSSVPDVPAFFIGDSTGHRWCMKADLWPQVKPLLKKAKFSRNVLAIVEDRQVERRVPALPEIEEARTRPVHTGDTPSA